MVKIRASCSAIGERFSPLEFEKVASVRLVDSHEPGAIGTAGVYRGKPTPYGAATIEVSDKAEEDWARFDDLLSLVESCINALRSAGAEEISLSCSLFHDGHCNFGFSHKQLVRIASLKVELTISCYSAQFQ